MIKLLTLAGLVCLTLAAPAKADIRADYSRKGGGGGMTIEVADNGDVRVSLGPDGQYMLFTSQGDYEVAPGPGGPVTQTLDALEYQTRKDRVDLVADRTGPPEQVHLVAAETIKLGKWSGRAYRANGSYGQPPHSPAVVIADDPKLAPLGKAYLHMLRFAQDSGGESDAVIQEMAARLETGGLLALGDLSVSSVSFEPLPADHFVPPGEVITLADVKEQELADTATTDAAWPSIRRASFVEGTLWTLDTSGGVGRVAEGGARLEPVKAPEKGVDLCRSSAGLWLFTQADKNAPVRLWTRNESGWIEQGQLKASAKAPLMGVECSREKPLLLFADRLIDSGDGKIVKLANAWQPQFGEVTLLRQGNVLYAGINAGEWGGGLRRINIASGTAALVQAGNIQDLCGGVLNAACDPVTGLAADPAHPGCLLVATGLVHMLSSGEIDRVCGTSVQRVYREPYTVDPHWTEKDADKSFSTVPFFAMAGGVSDAWAVAPDGLYRFAGDDTPEFHRFPKGIARPQIDWSHPGIVLVPTDMNRRYSLSGASLLLVAR